MTRRLIVAALALLALGGATVALASDRGAARLGAHWLAGAVKPGGDGPSADAIADLRATGTLTDAGARTRAAALRAGAKAYVTGAGSAAKVILGLAAAKVGNPRCAGTLDLLAALKRQFHNGIYGRSSFDDALALAALKALHEPVPAAAIAATLRTRGPGGFNHTLSATAADDVESTGLIIEGLRAAGVSAHNAALRAALAWMRSRRAPSGGYATGLTGVTEADSTGIALAAQHAMGLSDPRASRALIALQRPSGAIQYTATNDGSEVVASLDAVLGLSGRTLPVVALPHAPHGC